jgi:hypothetical protein
MKLSVAFATLAVLIVVQSGLLHAFEILPATTGKGAIGTAQISFTPTVAFNGSSSGNATGLKITIPGIALGSNATTTNSTGNGTGVRRLLELSVCTITSPSGATCEISYASGVLTIHFTSGTFPAAVPVALSITNFQNPTTTGSIVATFTFLSNLADPTSVLFSGTVAFPTITINGPYLKPLSSASIGFINFVCVAIVFAISAMNIL